MAFENARRLWARLRAKADGNKTASAIGHGRSPAPFASPGTCDTCKLNSKNWAAATPEASEGVRLTGICRLRGFGIVVPKMTCCKNYTAAAPPAEIDPVGAIYNIRSERDRTCIPWVGLIAPHPDEGACLLCGRAVENGIAINLLEGTVLTCGTKHYYQWWSLFLHARMEQLRASGERAYAEMCRAISPTIAAAHLAESREAYRVAIATARDLEQTGEIAALEARLRQIETAFRGRFPQ